MSLFLFHGLPSTSPLTSPKFPNLTYSLNFKRTPLSISASIIPARDRVIDFGRHKGKMLGTLPSAYLKWVSKNLITRDVEEWGQLADQVLKDPVYKDRIEWEFAENLLTGDNGGRTESPVEELLEVSERFGWDNDDKIGWSRIDFSLLGTSKGGRIPRKGSSSSLALGTIEKTKEKKRFEGVGGVKGKREMRIERQRLRRVEKTRNLEEKTNLEDREQTVNKTSNPFPGREALLKKVFNSRRVL